MVFNQEYLDKFVFESEFYKELVAMDNLCISHLIINNKQTFNCGNTEYNESDFKTNELCNTIYPYMSICKILNIDITGITATIKDCNFRIFQVMKEDGSIDKCESYICNNFMFMLTVDPKDERMWTPDNILWCKFFVCIDEIEENSNGNQ